MSLSKCCPTFENMMEELQVRLEKLEMVCDARAADIAPLEREIEGLELTSASYFEIRNRSFAAFRAKVKTLSQADSKLLAQDSVSVHCGDPLVDAIMFRKGIRKDDSTFRLLYGVHWHRVLEYAEDNDTLRVFGAHATALANDPNPTGHYSIKLRDDPESPIGLLEHAFETFINALEDGGYRQGYRNNPMALETMAYRKFWKTHKFYQDSLEI